jgi:hypothetical protein
MFFQHLALQVKLATLPLGAVIKFATFQIVVGDIPGQVKKSLISISRFVDLATICFTAGGGETEVLLSTGDWSQFYTGDQLYRMLVQNVKVQEGSSKDDLIEPLVEAISQLSLSGPISQEFRYGFDYTCKWRLAETPGRDERNIIFTLVYQPPGREAVSRAVTFTIAYGDAMPKVRLLRSGALVNVSSGPQLPFLTEWEQVELGAIILQLR